MSKLKINMKVSKFLIIVILVLGNFTKGFSQDTTISKKLDTIAQTMFQSFSAKDYNALLDMTYPKLFEIVPKKAMLPVITSMLEGNEEYVIKMPNETPNYEISKVFNDSINNTEFAFLSYDLKMNMTFKNQEFDEETQEMMIKMMTVQGMDVTFISKNSLDAIIKNSMTVFIKDDSTAGDWYMMNYDGESPLTFQLLTTKIIEKAKEHKQNLMLEDKKNN